MSTTYFHLNYKDKIVQPINNFFSALTDPASTHFVIGLPSAALQNQLVANATTFINDSGQDYVPEQVAALVQDQYQNAPQQTIQGIDAQITYKWETKFGRVALAGSGSWLDIHQRLFEGAPSQLVTGTIFNPPKYRFRGGPSWSNNQWSATITLNYVHSELDTSNYPSQAISSWTTTDAQASYRFGDSSNILSGLKLSAAVQNAFNREPPKVSTESTTSLPGVGYDSTNASALGRFISVYVTKAW